jgi:N-acetylglucosaminyl-diphospho-decaprenol L-rhamnosyltransferase
MRVLGIIVNYRTPELTVDAVATGVAALERLPGEATLVVVDNDSRDGSYDILRREVRRRGWESRVTVVDSGRNGGFGYGNNVAISRALASPRPPDYFYLQNPDAFPTPTAVERLVQRMESDARIGIAGSRVHGVDGEPHRTAFRFPTATGELEAYARMGPVTRALGRSVVAIPVPEGSVTVDWVAGASMMVRREVFERVGLFDETFFLYFEETDLCRRAQLAGFQTVYEHGSVVAHIGSASTGLRKVGERTPPYWFDSRRHYFRKNHGVPYLWLSNAAVVVGTGLCRLRRAIARYRGRDEPARFLRDFVVHSVRGGRVTRPPFKDPPSRPTRRTPTPPATPSAA